MIKCRGMKFRDEDDAHDYFQQRDLDDGVDKRVAGVSTEELSLEQAREAGRAVGIRGGSASLNPYQEGFPEYKEWEKARLAALGYSIGGIKR